jgi:hypothetical protein
MLSLLLLAGLTLGCAHQSDKEYFVELKQNVHNTDYYFPVAQRTLTKLAALEHYNPHKDKECFSSCVNEWMDSLGLGIHETDKWQGAYENFGTVEHCVEQCPEGEIKL